MDEIVKYVGPWKRFSDELPDPTEVVWVARDSAVVRGPTHWSDEHVKEYTYWAPCEPPEPPLPDLPAGAAWTPEKRVQMGELEFWVDGDGSVWASDGVDVICIPKQVLRALEKVSGVANDSSR